ncbi:hypothetical protein HXY33_06245 [Candidatus Bathyarchaeota archaeon]|nr:hypothetical protein [Candidatus Bathyarchaeota archaeon]
MNKISVIFVLCVFLVASALCKNVTAAIPIHINAKYSQNYPTIDGFLGSSEWNDTKRYNITLVGDTDIEAWLYVKHNGTHMYFGILVWSYATHATDEFAIAFDEGNDGGSGSGTRDFALTSLQEDLKICYSSDVLQDGYYNVSWYAKDVEIDFDAACDHETDHSTSPSEIEYWEGSGWVDDHWECEFAIPFVGNDDGTSDVSALSCNVTDVIGIKIQYFYSAPAENYYYPAGSKSEVLTYANLGFVPPAIESCDVTGEKKDTFSLYEDIRVNGTGFLTSATYDFYIVEDVVTWIDGLVIPTRVPGTSLSITSDTDGIVLPTTVWSDPSTIGAYDIIVDINGNGQYDEGIDALDNNDEVTAGFTIPEFLSVITLLLTFSLATILAIVVRRKHII